MSETAKMMVYDAKKKSTGVAYLLWFLLGGIGAHRFYVNRTTSGVIYLVLQVIGWSTVAAGLGVLAFGVIGIWWLIDAFLVPGMVRSNNLMLAAELNANTMSLPS